MAIITGPISIETAARTGKRLTYEEYLDTPTTNLRYEIIDGVVTMSPSGTSDHQWLVGEIYTRLYQYVREHRLGVVIIAPMDVVIRQTPQLKTRQPDVFYLSAERTGIRGRRGLRRLQRIDVVPELAVEILSPDETRTTQAGKLADYAEIGIPEVWLVSPEAETIEVLQLTEGSYRRAGLYGAGDRVASPVLPGLILEIDVLFAEEEIENEPENETGDEISETIED